MTSPPSLTSARAELVNGRDLFDLVFEVVDASLADVTDTFEGEPRVTLLELVRDFARGTTGG